MLKIDDEIKKRFGSWTAFSRHIGQEPSNFKRKLVANIDKINKWLEPLGLVLKIERKPGQ